VGEIFSRDGELFVGRFVDCADVFSLPVFVHLSDVSVKVRTLVGPRATALSASIGERRSRLPATSPCGIIESFGHS